MKAIFQKTITVVIFTLLISTSLTAGDWKQFRGDATNSVTGSENLPI